MSDVLYDWSEVLQPLWNVTLRVVAYVSANSLSPMVPRAFDSLRGAEALSSPSPPHARPPSPQETLFSRSPIT
ncbi:hypothetical protein FOZG_17258 [Fusarium oxysporum Fo47]|uniref:Uncharacterized protein n=1 Tax=Fusarium oxysporum Fo47 TaxID=660027 RepID=W9JAT9_FUSOX|nr:hypothetical protein FOZG_17258 [Fusarium oxysporum Fo47]